MSVLRHLSRLVHATACGAPLAIAAYGAQAATLQVSPVLVEVPANANASGLTLRNSGDTPIYGQIRVYKWAQAGGDDTLTPTQEVVASPPLTQIGAGAEQLVRLVRAAPGQPGVEQSYRILIDELPTPETAPSSGVAIRLRYSVPVFIDGPQGAAAKPQLAWHLHHADAGWTLEATNSGARRAQIARVDLVDGAGNVIPINKGLLGYALAGASRRWPVSLPADANLNGTLKIRAALNAVPTESPVDRQ